jgi:DNA end-binding protein Ku
VIIRTRQHLAAVKANGDLLVLELMRFADELVPASEISVPSDRKPQSRELAMAKTLVNQMSEDWDPDRYTDEYRSALMKLIDKKVATGGKELPGGHKPRQSTNVIDLAAALQQSLADAGKHLKGAKIEKRKGRARAA